MSIKKRFEELKRKEQIQLGGIVFMCYILVFVFYEDISDILFPKTFETTQKVLHKPLKIQEKRVSNLEVYRYLNSIVKKHHIDLVETKITQNSMKIDLRGEFDDIISLMQQYEENFIIDSYEMEQILDNRIFLSLRVNIEKFYEDKNRKKNDIKAINPYIVEVETIAKNRTAPQFKTKFINNKDEDIIIRAILNSEVLIDEKWYALGDIYEHFKVKEIRKRSVVFVDIKTQKVKIRRITNE